MMDLGSHPREEIQNKLKHIDVENVFSKVLPRLDEDFWLIFNVHHNAIQFFSLTKGEGNAQC